MPEPAAEAMRTSDDTRDELLAKAAALWTADGYGSPPGDLGQAVGDLTGFLHVVYVSVYVFT